MFIMGVIIDDVIGFIYKFRSYKTIYCPQRQCHILKFFMHDDEYTLLIPDGQLIPQDKILAMSQNYNKTDLLLKTMGPCRNFFGFDIKPLNLGLEDLTIWFNKIKYYFREGDVISFTIPNVCVNVDSSSEEESEEITV